MAEPADLLVEGLPRGPGDGVLAGRVDLRQDEDVGLVERRGELRHQLGQAGIAVGLEDGHDAAVEAPLRGLERRLDLGRVVGVVR
jgi:hypothetical protein